MWYNTLCSWIAVWKNLFFLYTCYTQNPHFYNLLSIGKRDIVFIVAQVLSNSHFYIWPYKSLRCRSASRSIGLAKGFSGYHLRMELLDYFLSLYSTFYQPVKRTTKRFMRLSISEDTSRGVFFVQKFGKKKNTPLRIIFPYDGCEGNGILSLIRRVFSFCPAFALYASIRRHTIKKRPFKSSY